MISMFDLSFFGSLWGIAFVAPDDGFGVCVHPQGASLIVQLVKNLPTMQETQFDSWVRKIPWRRAWQPTLVFWPGESPWIEEPGEAMV